LNLIFNAPAWQLFLCILAGLAYAIALYLRDRKLKEAPIWLKAILGAFRFIGVSIICFLLLAPLFANTEESREKPVLIFVHDNSNSLLIGQDSSLIQNEYKTAYDHLIAKLSDRFEIDEYTVGQNFEADKKLDFKAEGTNLALAFHEISQRYYKRNIGTIVLASDGIFNEGNYPLSAAKQIQNTSIYTIALGDTTIRKDLVVEQVKNNKTAFLGNDFPVEIEIKANKLRGEKFTLELKEGNKVLESKEIDIDNNSFNSILPFRISASKIGVHRYSVILSKIDGELTYKNNVKDFYIQVLSAKKKVLLLANGPHPDLGALRIAIERNQNYEANIKYHSKFDGNFEKSNLVILHQLPNQNPKVQQWLKQIETKKIPTLFIWGSLSNYGYINNSNYPYKLVGYRGELEDVTPLLSSEFNSFTISSELKNELKSFPPLHVPFGQQRAPSSQNVLCYQSINGIGKSAALISFSKWNGIKTGLIAGEGIWRWKLYKPKLFAELVNKTVQFLSVTEDKNRLRVNAKETYSTNEPLIINAEVFNESYELINDPELEISIKNENDDEFKHSFSKSGNAYRLNAGNYPNGTYTYLAKTEINGESFTVQGAFNVIELKREMINSVADHRLLYQIAQEHDGEMFFPNQLSKLEAAILNRDDMVDIVYKENSFEDLINWKLIFYLLLSLFSLEWLIRKWQGGY
jgi:hypothetical protein